MKRYKFYVIALFLCLFLGFSKTECFAAGNTYKIIYHYSRENSSRCVVQTKYVGSSPQILKASDLNFSSSKNIFLGWTVYRKRINQWIIFNRDYSIRKYGKKPKNLYIVDPWRGNQNGKLFNPVAGEEIHLYGTWMNANKLDVSNYYFSIYKQDYPKSTQTAAYCRIQNALDLAKRANRKITVYVPKNTYYINRMLIIYPHTRLKLAAGTVIKRHKKFYSQNPNGDPWPMIVSKRTDLSRKPGGYNQGSDFTIEGGIWQGNYSKDYFSDGQIMRFEHAQNITIKNTTVSNFTAKHAIVFAGVKNGLVSNVIFKNYEDHAKSRVNVGPPSATNYNRNSCRAHSEALHIDSCSQNGEETIPNKDHTICENIVVRNCTFVNLLSGVGSHVDEIKVAKRAQNFQVINNTFKNVKLHCIDLLEKEKALIYNNKVVNCDTYLYTRNLDKRFIISDHPELPEEDLQGSEHDHKCKHEERSN